MNERKLPLRVKIGFPMTNIGPTLNTCIQMYFLVYFYTNVLKINGGVAALIIVAARVWDFINDPMMAVLLARTKTKKGGTCLYWMKRSLPLICIFLILTYFAPSFSAGARIVWAVLTFVCLGMSQTAYSIPLNSLRANLTSDKVERQRLNRFEGVFSVAVNLLVPTVTMPFVAILQGMEVPAPFTILAVCYALVYLVCSLAGFVLLRGAEPEQMEAAETGSAVKASDMLKALAVNRVALLVLLAQVLHMFFSSITGSVLVYYVTYNLQNVNLMSISSSIGGVIGLLPILFLVPLYKKFGNAGTACLGAAICVAAMAVRFITHDATGTIFVSMAVIEAIGAQLTNSMMNQCLMDSIDYGEWKTGHKNVPILMSAMGIGTKIGLAFGSSIAGLVVGLVSFNPDLAEQPQHVLNAFFHMNVTFPIIVYAVMVLVFAYIMTIEKKLPAMREEVAARKQFNA